MKTNIQYRRLFLHISNSVFDVGRSMFDVHSFFGTGLFGRLMIYLLVTAVLSVLVGPSSAATTVTIDADKQFQYAEQLYSQKKHMMAVFPKKTYDGHRRI
jgi:hypothetical protein